MQIDIEFQNSILLLCNIKRDLIKNLLYGQFPKGMQFYFSSAICVVKNNSHENIFRFV